MSEFIHGGKSGRHEKDITRRSLLGVALAAGVAAVLGADKAPHPDYYPDYLKKLPEKPTEYTELEKFPPLTKQHVDHLFRELQRPAGSKNERHQAVKDSLRVIRTADEANGTAFQLDESGIYLTAAHTFFDDEGSMRPGVVINDPRSGATNPARQLFTHEAADLAVIYAPTGREPKATSGLQIDTAAATDGEQLQMVGKWPPENYLFLDSGEAKKTADAQATRFPVEGMIPFGGTSGSPVVDAEGRLRGVLAGSYGIGREMEGRVGAWVEPVSLMGSLPEHGRVL